MTGHRSANMMDYLWEDEMGPLLECTSEYLSANRMEYLLVDMTDQMLEYMLEYWSANRKLAVLWERQLDHLSNKS